MANTMIKMALLNNLSKAVLNAYRYDFMPEYVYNTFQRYTVPQLKEIEAEYEMLGVESLLKYLI